MLVLASAGCGPSRATHSSSGEVVTPDKVVSIEPLPATTEGPVTPAPPLDTEPPRLVIVTLDGVRWEDVFVGTDHAGDPPKRTFVQRATDTTPFKNLQRIVAERGAAFGGNQCPHDVRVA